jgi:hypothetical protein
MSKTVNLRRIRKQKARDDARRESAATAAEHGERDDAVRQRRAEEKRARALWEGHRRDEPND